MLKLAINQVVTGKSLSIEEARQVMLGIMEGRATEAQIGSLLTALRMKGETVEEITGCALAMREKASHITSRHSRLVDTCGTGGDGSGTFNISTTAAFVVAGAGVPVAKHGNRSVSSKSGSADLLEALGANLDLTPAEVENILNQVGIGFLFAPAFHKAMKYAVGPRREIGIRSIFNILGPLTNPAGAKVQVLGVFDPELTEALARVLQQLGVERALVVHGAGGLDEISTLGPTKVSYLKKGDITNIIIDSEGLGFPRVRREQLQGGDASLNAKITLSILAGEKGPCRDIVLINAGAALTAAGAAGDLSEGIKMAASSIDSGSAKEKLDQFIAATQSIRAAG